MQETEEEKRERIFKTYKDLLADDTIPPHIGGIRFNAIQYHCRFPGIDPVEMAASLKKDGHTIFFDDTSISVKENKAHAAAVEKAFQRLQQEAVPEEKHLTQSRLENDVWQRLEGYGLHCGGWNEALGKSAVCVATPNEGGGKVLGYLDPKTLAIEWIAPIQDIAAATLPAATDYYIDGQTYLVEQEHLCICRRWKDKEQGTEGINFEGEKRNLFCDPQRMGTFLPGVADKGLEISRWPDPELQKTFDAEMEQTGELEEGEELEP